MKNSCLSSALFFLLFLFAIANGHFESSVELLAAYAQELDYKLAELASYLEQLECDYEVAVQQPELVSCCADTGVGLSAMLKIELSSNNDVAIVKHNGTYYASLPGLKTPDFPLRVGDHNLWYGDNNDLWGYDKKGRLFVVTKAGRRLLTNASCNFSVDER